MAGMTPATAQDVHYGVGNVLRSFVNSKDSIHRTYDNMAGIDLKVPPYNMTPEDESLIKSAIADLNTALSAVNMVWINRLIGIY
jgi:hypothetical protein